MERWTIAACISGRFNLKISFGGTSRFWCMFDYLVRPDAAIKGLDIILSENVDVDSACWFPHVRRGMELGLLRLQESYRRQLVYILVEVKRIHAHPIDTTAAGCEYYGTHFIQELGQHKSLFQCSSE